MNTQRRNRNLPVAEGVCRLCGERVVLFARDAKDDPRKPDLHFGCVKDSRR